MTIGLLTKENLSILNRRTLKYPLAVAEKDYFLTLVSKIIFDSPLRDKLVFKGGTAIHHCYLPQYRFSEDVDFTALDKNISLAQIKAVLEGHDFLSVKKEYASKATIKIERLLYSGPLGLPNSLKFEVDFVQDVVLPACRIKYSNVWGVETDVMVMDIREICAEKIRACSSRKRYRDFYDLCLILDHFTIDRNEIFSLIRQKEIRKSMGPEIMFQNWGDALQEKKDEMARIYYSREIPDIMVEKMIKSLDFEVIGPSS